MQITVFFDKEELDTQDTHIYKQELPYFSY